MATLGDAIDRVFRHADQRGRIDKLSSSISSGSQLDEVTITPAEIGLWGAPLEVEIESEVFYVKSVDRSAGTATAVRGWRDSTTAAHASGTICRLAPRFFRMDAKDAIIDGLRRMAPPLWKVSATNITYATSTVGYDLVSGLFDVYRVWNQTNSSSQRWKEVYAFDVAHEMDTSVFASGKGLIIAEPCYPGPLRVQYFTKFTEPTAESDNMESTVGLSDYMLDVPVWYAVATLLPPDEALRSQVTTAVSQARAETVEGGQVVRAAEYYRARYEDALAEATDRFKQQYPLRLRYVRP